MDMITREFETELMGMLVKYDLNELNIVYRIAENDKDFDKVMKIIEVKSAITTILEYIEENR